jgi:hypothetical protein
MASDYPTPKDIFDELIDQGATPVQAFGILGNAIAESSLNPEANVVDSNGYRSYGLWQFNAGSYPDASSLVTGNAAKDMVSQVTFLFQNGGLAAATGTTAAQTAGNFAQGFERCSTCDPGGSSYDQRQSYANTVQGWAASNDWPADYVSAEVGAGINASVESAESATCAWEITSGTVLSLGFVSASGPSVCVISKTQARALVSAGMMVGGALLGIAALAVLVLTVGGGGPAARMLQAVPGVGTVTAVAAAAGA